MANLFATPLRPLQQFLEALMPRKAAQNQMLIGKYYYDSLYS